jgi:hypothetical protein
MDFVEMCVRNSKKKKEKKAARAAATGEVKEKRSFSPGGGWCGNGFCCFC